MWQGYRLRLERKRRLWRAFRRRHELQRIRHRTALIRPSDHLLFSTLRNERIRLPYFLEYYRALGIDHFLIVDNDSQDGSAEYLAEQPDVSLWRSQASYRRARFGVDWLNCLQMRYGHGHWCLVVDPDEFLVYPFCDTRPLPALTDWLDGLGQRAFPAMLLDMYPRGAITAQPYREGQNPFEIASWFDPSNYTISKNQTFWNLWIQGGPRMRALFRDDPYGAPTLNKIPLVKWHRSYCYVSSTHMLLPRGLNALYDEWGGERISGCLLHAKFLSTLPDKVSEELTRGEHYADSREYRAYAAQLGDDSDLWCPWSERYVNWRQLEIIGLMSKGGWA